MVRLIPNMEIKKLITNFDLSSYRASPQYWKARSGILRAESAFPSRITIGSILATEYLMYWVSQVTPQEQNQDDFFFLQDFQRVIYHSHRKKLGDVSLNHLILISVSLWGIKRRRWVLSFSIILGIKNRSILNRVKVSFSSHNINKSRKKYSS